MPGDKSGQAGWCINMAGNFGTVSTILEFDADDTAAWIADCRYAAFVPGPMGDPVEAFAKAVTGFTHTVIDGSQGSAPVPLPAAPAWPPSGPTAVPPGIDGRRQKNVDHIKSASAYTPLVIGALLRTESTGTPFDAATYQAVVRSAKETGQGSVNVAFSKASSNIDGVNLYLQRTGDAGPVKIGLFTHTPATDFTPLKTPGVPEQRNYSAVAVIADAEVGLRSAVVTVLVK